MLILNKKSGQCWPARLGSATEEPIPETVCAAKGQDGSLWFSTWGNGLFRLPNDAFDVHTGIATAFEQWKYDPTDPGSRPSNLLASIAVDAGNKVWVCGAENGLNTVDKSTGKVQRFMYEQGNANGISSNYTSELVIDESGDIWISMGLKLIERFSPETGYFKKYDASDGLPNYNISQIARDNAGRIWMNQTQAVSCIDPASGEVAIYPQVAAASLYHEAIAVHPETNEVYFACQEELRSFHPATFRNQSEEDSPIRLSKVSHYDPAGNGAMRTLPHTPAGPVHRTPPRHSPNHVRSLHLFGCGDVGVQAVILTVTDYFSNTATCSATITVADDDNPCCAAPAAACKPFTAVLNAGGSATLTAGDVDGGSTYACGL